MDRKNEQQPEITLDLSKLLGFQGLELPTDNADLREVAAVTHNKIGEIAGAPDRNT